MSTTLIWHRPHTGEDWALVYAWRFDPARPESGSTHSVAALLTRSRAMRALADHQVPPDLRGHRLPANRLWQLLSAVAYNLNARSGVVTKAGLAPVVQLLNDPNLIGSARELIEWITYGRTHHGPAA